MFKAIQEAILTTGTLPNDECDKLKNWARHLAYKMAYTRNHDDIEDIVQDSIVGLLKMVDHYDPQYAISTLFHRIVRNACIAFNNNLKKRPKQLNKPVEEDSHPEFEIIDKSSCSPSGNLDCDAIYKLLDQRERKIVDMRLIGMTQDEIAEHFSITRQAISSAFDKMAEKLSRSHYPEYAK